MAAVRSIILKPVWLNIATDECVNILQGDIETIKKNLDCGNYTPRHSCVLPAKETAEEVFEYSNMKAMECETESGMTGGDVIVWMNGKRELCLPCGWVYI